MKSGAPLKPSVQAYHGRPMCCAKPMGPHYCDRVKRDMAISQYYRCACCGKILVLYFNEDGTLHHNQTPRNTGRFRKTYH